MSIVMVSGNQSLPGFGHGRLRSRLHEGVSQRWIRPRILGGHIRKGGRKDRVVCARDDSAQTVFSDHVTDAAFLGSEDGGPESCRLEHDARDSHMLFVDRGGHIRPCQQAIEFRGGESPVDAHDSSGFEVSTSRLECIVDLGSSPAGHHENGVLRGWIGPTEDQAIGSLAV